jgi:hypothetical protein
MDAVHLAVEVAVLRIDADVRAEAAPRAVVFFEDRGRRTVDDQDITSRGSELAEVIGEIGDLARVRTRAPNREQIGAAWRGAQASAP